MEDTNAVPEQPAAQTPQTAHTLTIPDVAARFADAGVPRAARTLQTYCQLGTLDCIQVPGELGPKYLVSETSVEDRIKEFVQMRDLLSTTAGANGSRRSAHQRVEARTSAHERASAGDEENEIERDAKADKEMAELRAKLAGLESDVRARDAFINMLQQEKKDQFDRLWDYTQRISEQSREIGKLEAQLQLNAPRDTYPHTREVETPDQGV